MPSADVEQGSAQWIAARRGLITASRMADVMKYLKKGGESEKRADYRLELVSERLTGLAVERYVSKEMQFGTENEPFARAAYEMATGNFVDQVGFITHPRLDYSGASPDGCVGTEGLVEIKCPLSTTHIEYMTAGVPPDEYVPQMMWQMACTGRKWVDFVSYDPRMPEDLQLFTARLLRDEVKIAEMESEVQKLEREIQDAIAKLRGHK